MKIIILLKNASIAKVYPNERNKKVKQVTFLDRQMFLANYFANIIASLRSLLLEIDHAPSIILSEVTMPY